MKKTGTQGADELENGFPQLDDVEMLDPHSLHEAVRVVQHVIADRIPHVVEITEQEVLIVARRSTMSWTRPGAGRREPRDPDPGRRELRHRRHH